MRKYEIIKNDIIKRINEGKLAPGEKIPTEHELKKLYSVSSTTVVKALNELSLNGYLYRVQGRGTFVSKASRGILARYFENDYKKYDKSREKTILLNVDLYEVDNEHINDPFFLKNKLYKIERIKLVDETPILYSVSFVKKYLLDGSKKSDFKNFYQTIEKNHNINLFKAKRSLRFQSLKANKEIQNLLKIENIDNVIFIQQSTYLNESEKVEFTQTYKNSSFFDIDVETII